MEINIWWWFCRKKNLNCLKKNICIKFFFIRFVQLNPMTNITKDTNFNWFGLKFSILPLARFLHRAVVAFKNLIKILILFDISMFRRKISFNVRVLWNGFAMMLNKREIMTFGHVFFGWQFLTWFEWKIHLWVNTSDWRLSTKISSMYYFQETMRLLYENEKWFIQNSLNLCKIKNKKQVKLKH